MQPAACALPVTTPAHPRREPPCSRDRIGGAFPEGPAQLLKKGGHPRICTIVLHGDGGGSGEGKGPRGASASGREEDASAGRELPAPGRSRCRCRMRGAGSGRGAREAGRAAALPLRRQWRRPGMSTGMGAGPRARSCCRSRAALGALTAAPRDGCGPPARPGPPRAPPAALVGCARRPSPSRQLVCRAGRGTGVAAAAGMGLGPGCDITADTAVR